MDRGFYLELARAGIRFPIAADLILNEEAHPETVKSDARRLGAALERTAKRYGTPLAFPLMDLALEKADLLSFVGVERSLVDAYHFQSAPEPSVVQAVLEASSRAFAPEISCRHDAVRYIAEETRLVPVGMAIGPFSLMTKLVSDPISPVAMAGSGTTAEQDDGVATIERCLAMAEATVIRAVRAQIEAGARAVIICEPAANTVYLSPRQLRAGADIFERFVLRPNRRIRALLESHGVDLIFHNCGQLLTEMVRTFAHELRPVILSLGSSRKLWEDAAVVPKDIVLYGNLPTKNFYSDEAMPIEKVRTLTEELIARMEECGHPHITGSECDVLYVPEAAETICRKVEAMVTCGRQQPQCVISSR